MAIRKTSERYSLESLARGESDPRGRLFVSPLGQTNLEAVHVLASSVDTIRQLYTGTPDPDALLIVETAYDAGFKNSVDIGGHRWIVGSGGHSGYRFRLQNNELGLIAFLGSSYADLGGDGSHLKIECSPHWINARDPSQIDQELGALARSLLQCPQASNVAVHIAVDVQGWEPPADLQERLVARSKRQARWSGIDKADVTLSAVSACYGDRESYLFGRAGALQFALYRKDREARASDKWDYFRELWRSRCDRQPDSFDPVFDESAAVWRLEFRFHHSVIEQYAAGVGEKWRTFGCVAKHLTGLFRAALDSYRLDASRTYVDPMWQLLAEDVEIVAPAQSLVYKRVRKTPGQGNERNVTIAVGNLISIYARNGFTARQSLQFLRKSGLWHDLLGYLFERQIGISEFEQKVERELALRRLVGKAA